MKNHTFSDFQDRVQKTIEKMRQPLYGCDDSGNLIKDFVVSFETFEFLIFLEIRDSKGNVLLHHPVAIAHEPILEEVMREQIKTFSCLLPGYPVAVVSVENSLIKFEEWDLFDAYATAEEVVKLIVNNLRRKLKTRKEMFPHSFDEHKERSKEPVSNKKIIEEQTIEAIYFSKEGSDEPLPLIISACYSQQMLKTISTESFENHIIS